MTKVNLISTKQPPTWESWRELKGRDDPNKARLTMTQSEALAIFQEVVSASTVEDAVQFLKAALPTRRALTFWLGQIGHRGDVRLGKGKGYLGYVRAVVESFCNRNPDQGYLLERNREEEMAKKDQRPVVIVRKNKHRNGTTMSEGTTEGTHATGGNATTDPVGNEEMTSPLNGPEKLQKSEEKETSTSDVTSEAPPTTSVSKVQEYALRNLRVFADCAVQKDEEGIFHVLGRNFEDKPMLNFWLWKVGYAHLSKLGRNKDLVDFIRVLARELYREMKRTVGQPVARW